MILRATLGIALALLAGTAHGQTIGEGRGETAVGVLATPLQVLTNRPSCMPRLVIAVFHGLGRSTAVERDAVKPLADRLCAVVVVPLFDAARFPYTGYQLGEAAKGGIFLPPGDRTVDMVAPLIDWARTASGQANLPYALMGHSAGGQFLQRFLALPITVLLGQFDTGSENLSTESEAVAQGENRLVRGRNTITMAEKTARERGWALGWTKAEVPAVGHSVGKMFGSKQATEAFK